MITLKKLQEVYKNAEILKIEGRRDVLRFFRICKNYYLDVSYLDGEWTFFYSAEFRAKREVTTEIDIDSIIDFEYDLRRMSIDIPIKRFGIGDIVRVKEGCGNPGKKGDWQDFEEFEVFSLELAPYGNFLKNEKEQALSWEKAELVKAKLLP